MQLLLHQTGFTHYIPCLKVLLFMTSNSVIFETQRHGHWTMKVKKVQFVQPLYPRIYRILKTQKVLNICWRNEPRSKDNVLLIFSKSHSYGGLLQSIHKGESWTICPRCYELNCIFQNSYVKVVALSTLDCDLIWRQDNYRGNQSKVRSLG